MSKDFSMLKTNSQRVAGNNKVVIFYQNKIYMTFIVTRYYILLRLAVVSHAARTGHAYSGLFTLFRFSSDDHLIQSMVFSWEVLRSLGIVLGLSGRQQRTLRVYSSFYHDIIVILTGALSALCGTILYLRDCIVKFYFPCYYMA